MLRKLLKYEFKATSMVFLPLYLTIAVFAILNRFFFIIPDANISKNAIANFFSGLSMTVYVSLLIGMVVLTLVVQIQRFYKSLLGDEGYLMFTLPVETWKHIASKLIVSTVWTFASGIIAFCSIFFVASIRSNFREGLSYVWNAITDFLGNSIYLVGIELLIFMVLAITSTVLLIYASIALGHLFSKYKLLASFGMFMVLKTVSQMILTPIGLLLAGTKEFSLLINSSKITPVNFIPTISQINLGFLCAIGYFLILAVGYYVITNYILRKKLNLE